MHKSVGFSIHVGAFEKQVLELRPGCLFVFPLVLSCSVRW